MRVLAFVPGVGAHGHPLRATVETEAPTPACAMTLDLAVVDDPPAGGRPGHAQRLLVADP